MPPPTLAQFGWLVLAVIGSAGCLSFGLLFHSFLQPPLLYWRDFVQDWLWARAVLEGVNPYISTPALASIFLGDCCPVHLLHASPHPPLAGLLVFPVAGLDLSTASLVWAAVEITCLAAALWLLVGQPWAKILVLTGALLAWHAMRTELVHGQFTTMQLLLLVLARRDLRTGRDVGAGVPLGIALCVKPILLPVVVLFALWRRTAVLAGLTGTVAVVGVISTVILGPSAVADYVAELPRTGAIYRDYALNISLWTVGWKLFLDDPVLASGVSMAAAVAFLGALVKLLWRPGDRDLAFGAAIAASAVLNPVAWDIYTILLILPAAQVVTRLRARGWPRAEVAALFTLGCGAVLPPGIASDPPLALVPMVIVVAFTLYVAFRAAQATTLRIPHAHAASVAKDTSATG